MPHQVGEREIDQGELEVSVAEVVEDTASEDVKKEVEDEVREEPMEVGEEGGEARVKVRDSLLFHTAFMRFT